MPTAQPSVHILLVEDSEDDAFFFSRTLKIAGVPAKTVHIADGGGAIAHMHRVLKGETPSPDIVFLDLKLPTRTGFEILEWLRAHVPCPPFNVFVLSGSEQEGDIARALVLGASGYCVKPIQVDALKARLAQIRSARTDGASSPRSPVKVA